MSNLQSDQGILELIGDIANFIGTPGWTVISSPYVWIGTALVGVS